MISILRAGDVVVASRSNGEHRKILRIESGFAYLEGTDTRFHVSALMLPALQPEHVARFMMARPEDDIPAVVAWVREDEAERRPRLVANVHQIVGSERGMTALMLNVNAELYHWDDSRRVAEQVVDYFLREIPTPQPA